MSNYTNGEVRLIPTDKITISDIERLFGDTIRVNECRLRLNPHHTGYSFFGVDGTKYQAHRVIRVLADGADNTSRVVDHLCRNRSCVRLSHLEMTSLSENIRRGTAWWHFVGRTHCKNGHEFTAKNTRVFSRTDTRPGDTRRQCRTCHKVREQTRRRYVKEKRS